MQNAYMQLDNWCKADKSVNTNVNTSDSPAIESEDLYTFLKFARESISPDCKLIIVYQPVTGIDSDGRYVKADEAEAISEFSSACTENGILFLDLSEGFESLYQNEHILAHGFQNTAVGEGHLNAAGHRVFAEWLIDMIEEDRHTSE